MRIGILSPNQTLRDTPKRYVSKTVAALLVRRLLVERVTKHLIRELKIGSADSTISNSARFTKPTPEVIPTILPPREPEGLLLQYPHPDQSSYAIQHFRETWS